MHSIDGKRKEQGAELLLLVRLELGLSSLHTHRLLIDCLSTSKLSSQQLWFYNAIGVSVEHRKTFLRTQMIL